MDRQSRRFNETRTVTISQVDMSNQLISGRDQYGTFLQISMHINDPLMAVPSVGETWTVERNGNLWFLDKISDDGTERNGLKTLGTGDRRIDTSGNIYLNGNSLVVNGSTYPPPPATTVGILSAQPVYSSLPTGSQYYATDQDVMYINTGSAWQRTGLPAGSTTLMYGANAVAPTGWVRYDGSILAGSTGIYASLYAHLGNTTTLPDTRGRMGVDKGTHADVSTIGNSDGLTVANRRPKHKHTKNGSASVTGSNSSISLSDPGHYHALADYDNSGGGYYSATGSNSTTVDPPHAPGNQRTQTKTTGISLSGSNSSIGVSDTITVGPQTGAEPTDSTAYLVGLLIAKL